MRYYSQAHNEHFPQEDGAKGLEVLRTEGYLKENKFCTCRATHGSIPQGAEITDANCSYGFKGGLTQSDDSKTPIAWDKPENHKDCWNILFVDGHDQRYSGEEWLMMCKKWNLNK